MHTNSYLKLFAGGKIQFILYTMYFKQEVVCRLLNMDKKRNTIEKLKKIPSFLKPNRHRNM